MLSKENLSPEGRALKEYVDGAMAIFAEALTAIASPTSDRLNGAIDHASRMRDIEAKEGATSNFLEGADTVIRMLQVVELPDERASSSASSPMTPEP